MKSIFRTLLVAALASFAFQATAQVSGAIQSIAPLTRDLGAIVTLSAQTAATVSSTAKSGYNVSRVICAFSQSTYTGNPSTTFAIQNYDGASGQYYALVTSAAITSATAVNTPQVLSAGASIASSAVSANVPIAAKWRVSTVVAGTSTPVVTGTVGCNVQ